MLTELFSGKLVQALCWTLVHSLWIGLLLTIITGLVMIGTKKQTPALRYNLLSGLFAAYLLAVFLVFIGEYSAANNAVQSASIAVAPDHSIAAAPLASTQPVMVIPGFTVSVTSFLDRYAGFIVMAWFLIIVFRCARLGTGLYRLHQLRHRQLTYPGDEWNRRLQELAGQMRIKVPVRFFQSGIAKIPAVAGHFKPVILLPVGVLTRLPQDEIEAILVHELAHIRRKDYLVNLLQYFAEILFFFNPAVLWISSLIRIEREHCCDDIAVAYTQCKRNYINALVSFQEYHFGSTTYATALTGKKDHLLQRVKRILGDNNKTLNGMEKTFLALCLIITTSVSFIFLQAQTTPPQQALQWQTGADSIPSLLNRRFNASDFTEGTTAVFTESINGVSHTLHVAKRNGVLYEIYDDVRAFKINGKFIPREHWAKYKALMTSIKKAEPEDNATVGMDSNDNISQQKKLYLQDSIQKQENISKKQVLEILAEEDALEAGNQERIKLAEEDKAREDKKLINANSNINLNTNKNIRKTNGNSNTRVITGITYTVDDNKTYQGQYPDNKDDHERDVKKYDVEKIAEDLIQDLIKEKVIPGKTALSYKMSNDVLIVNGKVQPSTLHKKLKDKYLKSPDWQLVYNWRL